MQTIETDVIVIGAGPAGLCLGRALQGSGLRVTVLEREAARRRSTDARSR